MSVFDVRNNPVEEITEIVFAEPRHNDEDNTPQAYSIEVGGEIRGDFVAISDAGGECVFINSKEHAENLIKALNKAIELNWVK